MKDIIKTDELYYKSGRKNTFNFGKYSLPFVFLRDIHEIYLLLKDANNEQSKFANELKNIDKVVKSVEKNVFSK